MIFNDLNLKSNDAKFILAVLIISSLLVAYYIQFTESIGIYCSDVFVYLLNALYYSGANINSTSTIYLYPLISLITSLLFDLGFKIGPLINCGNTVNREETIFKMLIEQDVDKMESFIKETETLNKLRKDLTKKYSEIVEKDFYLKHIGQEFEIITEVRHDKTEGYTSNYIPVEINENVKQIEKFIILARNKTRPTYIKRGNQHIFVNFHKEKDVGGRRREFFIIWNSADSKNTILEVQFSHKQLVLVSPFVFTRGFFLPFTDNKSPLDRNHFLYI